MKRLALIKDDVIHDHLVVSFDSAEYVRVEVVESLGVQALHMVEVTQVLINVAALEALFVSFVILLLLEHKRVGSMRQQISVLDAISYNLCVFLMSRMLCFL